MKSAPRKFSLLDSSRKINLAARWLLLPLIVLLAYLPALQGGFIWDDDSMLTNNAAVKSGNGLYYIWFSSLLPDYFPLTSSSLWLEWRLWGMNPAGYHLTNVLLHAASAVLLWRVLLRLGIPGAWLAALLFAVHPVNVESVAWITERKNTLAMFFFLLSVLWYLRDLVSNPWLVVSSSALPALATSHSPLVTRHTWYWFSLVAFLCALLSKTAVVMAPFVLLLCTWWLHRSPAHRLTGSTTRLHLLRTIPFFALSLVFGLVTIWFQYHRAIGTDPVETGGLGSRLAGAGMAVWFYLFKAIIPLQLSFVYPRWDIDPHSILSYLPVLALVLAAAIFWRFRRSWGRPALFALAYLILMLAPVLGFFKIYFQRYSLVADHWQYFSVIGVIALVVGGFAKLFGWSNRAGRSADIPVRSNLESTPGFRLSHALPSRNLPRTRRASRLSQRAGMSALRIRRQIAGWAFATVAVISFFGLTFQQTKTYASNEALWRDTLEKNPNAWLAHNNWGQLLADEGRYDEAMAHYADALRIKPDQVEAHNNLGSALLTLGRLDEAAAHFERALQIDPHFAMANYNLGNVADQQGRRSEAIAYYRRALDLLPDYPDAHNNLACLLASEGKTDEAVSHLRQALRARPEYADACNNLGSILTEQGNLQEASQYLFKALKINPNYADAHHNLANALFKAGRLSEATEQYSTALQLKPGLAEAHYKLGNLCLNAGNKPEALHHYRAALGSRPDFAEVHYQLGVTLTEQKQVEDGVKHFQETLRLKPDWLEALNNLAWIFATQPDEKFRNGEEALHLANRAVELSSNKSAGALDTLAAAQAETEKFAKAAETARQARELAVASGQKELAQQIEARLALYLQNRPYRE